MNCRQRLGSFQGEDPTRRLAASQQPFRHLPNETARRPRRWAASPHDLFGTYLPRILFPPSDAISAATILVVLVSARGAGAVNHTAARRLQQEGFDIVTVPPAATPPCQAVIVSGGSVGDNAPAALPFRPTLHPPLADNVSNHHLGLRWLLRRQQCRYPGIHFDGADHSNHKSGDELSVCLYGHHTQPMSGAETSRLTSPAPPLLIRDVTEPKRCGRESALTPNRAPACRFSEPPGLGHQVRLQRRRPAVLRAVLRLPRL